VKHERECLLLNGKRQAGDHEFVCICSSMRVYSNRMAQMIEELPVDYRNGSTEPNGATTMARKEAFLKVGRILRGIE
jgi:hypothetical protein